MKRLFAIIAIALFFAVATFTSPARATISLDATFKASDSCEALRSIRKQTNPGNVRLTAGETYRVIGKNKDDETHYLLRIEGVTNDRWVATGCGSLSNAVVAIDDSDNENTEEPDVGDGGNPDDLEHVLALSWQPAFCETRPGKTECRTLTAQGDDSFAAANFSIHGLWPNQDFDPNDDKPGVGTNDRLYCGVSPQTKRLDEPETWLEMPPTDLTAVEIDNLEEFMPGVTSGLHLHEWYKHGTCYSDTAQEYYAETLALQAQVNASQVRDLFASNIGERITDAEIRQAFDDSFGPGAGERVRIDCRNGNVQELKINLVGDIAIDTPIADLIRNAPRAGSGCNSGRVDRF